MQFKGQRSGVERNGKTRERQHIQVLLLLIQHGANGLNMLEAQHVVLIEPLLNPAAEAQAVNRVHRIGQKKTTFVHRFIVCTIAPMHHCRSYRTWAHLDNLEIGVGSTQMVDGFCLHFCTQVSFSSCVHPINIE